jgi:hypothetical protein
MIVCHHLENRYTLTFKIRVIKLYHSSASSMYLYLIRLCSMYIYYFAILYKDLSRKQFFVNHYAIPLKFNTD